MKIPRIPWHAYLVVYRPRRILRRLNELVQGGVISRAPSIWQVELGVLRMWLRVLFRPQTIGTCQDHPVRPTWRARLLRFRFIRGIFLIAEQAIAPFDQSGLCSPTQRIVRHLLAAHHDRQQFAYDLQMLRATPEALQEVRTQALAVVEEKTRRALWLRDLVVYQRYHEQLIAAVDDALADRPLMVPDEVDDPDIGFDAYIRWCLAQPNTPWATWKAWRAGTFPRPVLPQPREATQEAA
jgi:hypothetical protein